VRQWYAIHCRCCKRILCRMAEALVANGSRQSPRRRARHSGRLVVRRRRFMESLLCILLVRYGEWRSGLRQRSERVVGRGRHFFCVADHGRNPGIDQSEGRRAAGQSRSRLLSTRGCRVRYERKQRLQLEQWHRRRQYLRFLRCDFWRHGRGLRWAQLLLGWRTGWGTLHFQHCVQPCLRYNRRLGLRYRHRYGQRRQPGEQLVRFDKT
jgi:hypothetical protein